MKGSAAVVGAIVCFCSAAVAAAQPTNQELAGHIEGARAIVVMTLASDAPTIPGQVWVGRLVPQVREVEPGAFLVPVNLSYEKVKFTFPDSLFVQRGNEFWVDPDRMKVLQLKANLQFREGEESMIYGVWSQNAFRDYPGPIIRVP
jgi:hypothetical protein